jgi:hypothetical protein
MAIAYLLDPLALRLQRWGMSRTLATVSITLFFFIASVTVLVSPGADPAGPADRLRPARAGLCQPADPSRRAAVGHGQELSVAGRHRQAARLGGRLRRHRDRMGRGSPRQGADRLAGAGQSAVAGLHHSAGDLLFHARLERSDPARRRVAAAPARRHHSPAIAGDRPHSLGLGARPDHGLPGARRDLWRRPVGGRARSWAGGRIGRGDLIRRSLSRHLHRPGGRDRPGPGPVAGMDPGRRSGRRLHRRPSDRGQCPGAAPGRRQDRAASCMGDLRPAGRRRAVRVSRHHAGPADGGGDRRADPLRHPAQYLHSTLYSDGVSPG